MYILVRIRFTLCFQLSITSKLNPRLHRKKITRYKQRVSYLSLLLKIVDIHIGAILWPKCTLYMLTCFVVPYCGKCAANRIVISFWEDPGVLGTAYCAEDRWSCLSDDGVRCIDAQCVDTIHYTMFQIVLGLCSTEQYRFSF